MIPCATRSGGQAGLLELAAEIHPDIELGGASLMLVLLSSVTLPTIRFRQQHECRLFMSRRVGGAALVDTPPDPEATPTSGEHCTICLPRVV